MTTLTEAIFAKGICLSASPASIFPSTTYKVESDTLEEAELLAICAKHTLEVTKRRIRIENIVFIRLDFT